MPCVKVRKGRGGGRERKGRKGGRKGRRERGKGGRDGGKGGEGEGDEKERSKQKNCSIQLYSIKFYTLKYTLVFQPFVISCSSQHDTHLIFTTLQSPP